VRPATVTISSYLLYFVAALQIVSAGVSISSYSAMETAYKQAYADFPELSDAASGIAIFTVVFAVVIGLIFGAGFVTLGILNGKGKNPARIVTWVLAGLGVCCFGLNAVGQAALSSIGGMGGTSGSNQPDPAEVQRVVNDALPSWYAGTTTAISVINVIAMLAVIILLMLPASNAFFRKPEPTANFAEPGYPTLG
jgi:hypothetical protein